MSVPRFAAEIFKFGIQEHLENHETPINSNSSFVNIGIQCWKELVMIKYSVLTTEPSPPLQLSKT